MNTRDDLERIKKHIHDIPDFSTTPLLIWVNSIAEKLDEYQKLIEEKDRAIQRFIEKG
jgi:hypothetical protein